MSVETIKGTLVSITVENESGVIKDITEEFKPEVVLTINK